MVSNLLFVHPYVSGDDPIWLALGGSSTNPEMGQGKDCWKFWAGKLPPNYATKGDFLRKCWMNILSSRNSMLIHSILRDWSSTFYWVVPVQLLRFQIIHSGLMPWSATLTRSVSQPLQACTLTLTLPKKWWLGNYLPLGNDHFQLLC